MMKCKSGKHEWTDPRDAVKCCDGIHCRNTEIADGSGGEIADIIVVRTWTVCSHEWQSSHPFTHRRCVRCNRIERAERAEMVA